jgi:hypothetical protein
VERRVVLLSKDTGLASIVGLALANGDRVAHIRSTADLTDWSQEAVAAVVLDSRPQTHRLSYKQVRDRYRGPLVMLLDRGERHPNLPPDGARRYLYRPFSAADVTAVLVTPPPELGVLETAIIDAWSRHARPDAPAKRPEGLSYRVSWGPSARRRLRAWVWTVAAMMGLLLVFNVSDQGACGPGCTSFSAVAGASESRTPLTSRPPSGAGGGSGGGRTGQATMPGPGPGPAGVPLVSGIGGLIESINPITATDPTPPAAPKPVPGVPSPTPPPTTVPPPTTTPTPTTAPPTTAPPTTAPPTTEPPTTAPPTTAPPTTEPPTTAPPTTEPPTTEPPTTAPPTTEPPTTAPATT